MKNKNSMHFFLASNPPKGFFSKMDIFGENLPKDWKCNVIKGSPGCGKSTYMKNIAKKVEEMNMKVEYIHCPSDPSSLDAVIFDDLKLCYVDGTAPHVIDPVFPGISGEIIDLGKLKNTSEILKNKDKIFDLNENCKKLYNQAQKYLIAFSSILSNSVEQSIENLDFELINEVSTKISKKFFKKKLSKDSKLSTRLISSVGPKGFIFMNQSFKNYEFIYKIDDDLNLVSSIIFKSLLNSAMVKGYDAIISVNPIALNEKINSLMFPEINLAFVCLNRWNKLADENIQLEFLPVDTSSFNSKIIEKDLKILDLLMEKSSDCMALASDYHLSLEKLYS